MSLFFLLVQPTQIIVIVFVYKQVIVAKQMKERVCLQGNKLLISAYLSQIDRGKLIGNGNNSKTLLFLGANVSWMLCLKIAVYSANVLFIFVGAVCQCWQLCFGHNLNTNFIKCRKQNSKLILIYKNNMYFLLKTYKIRIQKNFKQFFFNK